MRTVGSSRDTTWPVIRKAGIKLLYSHGFEAMNLRELAKESGLQPGSLYNYFSSKEEFLFRLICEVSEEILEEMTAALAPIDDPVDQIRTFVGYHIDWHTRRREETFIGNMEMRSLSAERYRTYVGLRKRYEDLLTGIIKRGCDSGAFSVQDVRVTTFSILSMLTGVSYWFRPNGRISRQGLIDIYIQMVLSILRSGGGLQDRKRESAYGSNRRSTRRNNGAARQI
jgi:AcrR family transcriptional regulator